MSKAWGCRWLGPFLIAVLVLLCGRPAFAQPIPRDSIPPDLAPWVPWVLDEIGDESCTVVGAGPVCAWPGSVTIDADEHGATFKLEVVLERPSKIMLPGSDRLWPLGVKDGLEDVVVLGGPSAIVGAGAHTIEGRISWRARPDVLPVPPNIARVVLRISGKEVRAPSRGDDGGLVLSDGDAPPEPSDPAAPPPTESDRVEVEVFRKITDGVPLRVTTRLELKVSGRARELTIADPTLPGGVVVSLTSGLPVRLEADGRLVASAKGGAHSIEIVELHPKLPEALPFEARQPPWPSSEVWAWEPALAVRQAELDGGAAVDPSRTNAPHGWRALSMYTMRAGNSLGMKTLRRGDPEPAPSKLKLGRTIWVDADGDGYTVVDRFDGQINKEQRLDFTALGQLGSVRTRLGDQLITLRDGGSGPPGVELREGSVQVAAEWRGEGKLSTFPSVGWSVEVESLEVMLHLPPGWELIGASGPSLSPTDWLGRWEAFDVMVLLGIALLIGRVFRPSWGVLAAVSLALAHSHDDQFRWALLGATVAAALARWAPSAVRAGARFFARALALALVFYALALAVRSGQRALWPQALPMDLPELVEVEQVSASSDNKEGGTGTRAKGEEGSMGNPTAKSAHRFGVMGPMDALSARGNLWGSDTSEPLEARAGDAIEIAQTGHGVPRWRFVEAPLIFNGPVDATKDVRVHLLSPTQGIMLAVLRVLLAALLTTLVVRRIASDTAAGGDAPAKSTAGQAPALAAVFALLALLPMNVGAEPPSKEMLDDLKARLTRPARCAPDCLAVSGLSVRAAGDRLVLSAEVHAGAVGAYQLPGPVSQWSPRAVEVDGRPATALVLVDGSMWLRLGPGRHEVKMSGPLTSDSVALSVFGVPLQVSLSLEGWTAEGVDEQGVAEGTITLTRASPGEPPKDPQSPSPTPPVPQAAPAGGVAPWVEVQRTFDFGVKFSVSTAVKRVSPVGTPLLVKLPLLPGEKVTDGRFQVEGHEVTVALEPNATTATFVSTLESSEKFELSAAADKPWTESWIVRCSPIWRCTQEGLAPVERMQSGGLFAPKFLPWPGERMTLRLSRPAAAPGNSTTVDLAHLELTPSDSLEEAKLTMHIRSSQGGVHNVQLPPGAKLESLHVRHAQQAAQLSGSTLPVTLQPGPSLVSVEWKAARGAGVVYRAPEVVVGESAANLLVTVHPPGDELVAFTGGPHWGPVVLWWAYALAFVFVALGLARLRTTPFTPATWAGLAVGLTLVPAWVAFGVATWLCLIEARRGFRPGPRKNLVQVALAAGGLFAFGGLAMAAMRGLTGSPDLMLGLQASAVDLGPSLGDDLRWYSDQGGALPRPIVLFAPTWAYRAVFGLWAAWVALVMSRFARRAWENFSTDGVWRSAGGAPPLETTPAAAAPAPASPAPAEPRAEGRTEDDEKPET